MEERDPSTSTQLHELAKWVGSLLRFTCPKCKIRRRDPNRVQLKLWRFEFLSCLQTNKLACRGHVYACARTRSLHQRTDRYYSQQHNSQNSTLTLVPRPQLPGEWHGEGQIVTCTWRRRIPKSWDLSSSRTARKSDPRPLWRDWELHWNADKSCLGRDLYNLWMSAKALGEEERQFSIFIRAGLLPLLRMPRRCRNTGEIQG